MPFALKILKHDGSTENLTVSDSNNGNGISSNSFSVLITKKQYQNLTQEEVNNFYDNGVHLLFIENGYHNLITEAINENGVIYYGCGYRVGYRLTSSGGISAAQSACVTGYMPYSNNAIFRIVGSRHLASAGGQYVAAYDASFGLISVEYMATLIGGGSSKYNSREDGTYELEMDTSKISAWQNAAYFRVSCSSCVGTELIVTKNQEIGVEVNLI